MATPEGIQFEQNQDAKLVELKEKIADAFSRDPEVYFSDKLRNFYKFLQEKYSTQELQKCLLWHTIILSTPNGTETTFDMPEGEIEKFINENF